MDNWRRAADAIVSAKALPADTVACLDIMLDSCAPRSTGPDSLKAMMNQNNPHLLAHACDQLSKNSLAACQ